jgi:hypothetical protein
MSMATTCIVPLLCNKEKRSAKSLALLRSGGFKRAQSFFTTGDTEGTEVFTEDFIEKG